MRSRRSRRGLIFMGLWMACVPGDASTDASSPCAAREVVACDPRLLETVRSYLACSEMASRRMLSQEEVHRCTSHYTAIKAQLAGVTLDRYRAMPSSYRAEVNRRGYAALLRWKEEDPELWSAMEPGTGSSSRMARP